MSWTRLKYDTCEQKKAVHESVGPGNYRVEEPLNCGACFQSNPSIIMQKSGVSLQGGVDWRFYNGPVDVESDLRNLNRFASRCPSDKYIPKCSDCGCIYQGQPCGSGVAILCQGCKQGRLKTGKKCGDESVVDFPDCYFPVEHSRLSGCTPRGVGLNRFDPLCLDPQANVFFPGAYQIPTRLVVKSNFRPCISIPAINDMTPPQRACPVVKLDPTVTGVYSGALRQYDVCG
jgi:hypothetical protein